MITEPEIERTGRSGWPVVIAYAVFAAVVQAFWLTFAPIDTSAATHYGVSTGAIGWLAEVCLLLYVLLALPAGRLLDRSFRPALAAGVAFVVAGGVVRSVDSSFAWAIAGQVLVGLGQPLVVTAVAKVAGDYLPERDRQTGIAVGASAGFVGMFAALVLGPTLGGDGELDRLLLVEAGVGIASGAVFIFLLHGRAPLEALGGVGPGTDGARIRSLWALPQIRVISGLAFVGFGIFTAITTWLQSLLEPAGISERTAAALLIGMLVCGLVGCAAVPPRLASLRAEQAFLRAAVATAAVGPLLLAATTSVAVTGAVLGVMGLALLPALPVLLNAAERVAGVAAAGTAGAIVWLSGNLGGVVAVLLVQGLIASPSVAFLALSAFALLAMPFAWGYALSAARAPA